MVSVLIPVYQEVVDSQLALLCQEIKNLAFDVEIIVCNDAAPNSKIPNFIPTNHADYKFIQLKENIGRAKIRNYLANQAKYDQLIFMDADCLPISPQYILNYVQNFDANQVIVGGQLFSDEPPTELNRMLRWNYGSQVEAISLKKRLKSPYKSFIANNFSISKNLISKFPFDEEHCGYGHEDTLFGMQLNANQVSVKHIDNPVRHIGLETNKEFIEKTVEGVKNLAQLYLAHKVDAHVKLIKVYHRLQSTGLVGFSSKMIEKRIKSFQNSNLSKPPSLRNFALFKLGVFILEVKRLQAIGNKP